MKTYGIHISTLLNDYRKQCMTVDESHEFTMHLDRQYFGLTTDGVTAKACTKEELKQFPMVAILAAGEPNTNVLRIHAFKECNENNMSVYNDSHVEISEENKARINATLSCTILTNHVNV